MNEDTFNLEIRKFLKRVGVTSQREVEKAVRDAMGSGKLSGSERLPVKMTIEIVDLELRQTIEGEIALE
jgi:hypothetical protein